MAQEISHLCGWVQELPEAIDNKILTSVMVSTPCSYHYSNFEINNNSESSLTYPL